MLVFEHVEEIERPVDEVFAYVTDVSKLPEWETGVLEVTADGPLRVGAHLRERRRFAGRTFSQTLEVTEYDMPHVFTLASRSSPVRFTARHTFEPTNGGTRLIFRGEADPPRVLRLTQRMLTKIAERELRGYFANLKRILESES